MGEGFAEGYSVGLGQNTQNNSNNCGFGNDGWSWIWIILIFAIFGGWGFGGNGFGNNGGGGSMGAYDNYVLASDFATLQRQIDSSTSSIMGGINTINSGLCDGFYTQAQLVNGVNMNLMQNGYETRNAINGVSAQLADCCCKTQNAIQANTTQGVMNTNAIQNQISSCCCDIEKSAMQTRFDAQQMNCNTLQAIDKVGDRIIDYLAADKAQALRDENFTLKLAASQANQNNYLVNQLRPCPTPAYITCNPWASQAPYGSCGCGCGCN